MEAQVRNVIGAHVPKKTYVSNEKEKNVDHIQSLASAITAGLSSDSEKAYALYRWIAANIAYDNSLRIREDLQRKIYVSEQSVVKNVLERRMALCGGFAFLFRELCEKAKIPVKVVHGYTKDFSGRNQNYSQPNHTWNVVKLNGKWQLLDITWAIGHGNKDKPDDFWYRTRPKDFIYSHYPQNPEWTLLDNPISFADFIKK